MNAWYQQLHSARTAQELVQAANEFAASLSPHEWNSLPENCRPARIKGVDDFAFWHNCLAGEYLAVAAAPNGHEVLREVLAFFAAADRRATEMFATASREAAANDVHGRDTTSDGKQRS